MTSAEVLHDIRSAVNFAKIRHTRIENVLYLIQCTIHRIKISIILPKLAHNLDHMEQRLKGTVMSPAVKLLSRLFLVKFSKDMYIDQEILKIIQFFHENNSMYHLFPRYFNELSTADKTLMVACETLLVVARRHLKRSAKVEINLEKQLREMYLHREEFKAKILRTKATLKSQNIALRWKMAAKAVILEAMERDLADRKWKNNVYIQNEISTREHELLKSHKGTLKKQNELQVELKKARDDYDVLLKHIRYEEREARSMKNKLIIQLQMLLHKFDSNMVEKNLECLVLEDQYNVASKQLAAFMVGYRKEEAVYKKIVVQFEMEEQRKQQERIALFMMNRAARRIQQYWQKWRRDKRQRERRAGRKKKK